MSEIDAIKTVDAALSALNEDERIRVLQWAIAKFRGSTSVGPSSIGRPSLAMPLGGGMVTANEIPGIAALTPDGEFKLTVRDVKASNTNDAAVRIAHLVIWAHQQLKGEPSVSSKKVLVPILRKWRAYTGNTRNILAKHQGILREGDKLSLDMHAAKAAQKYADEALDEAVMGSWAPRSIVKQRKAVRGDAT